MTPGERARLNSPISARQRVEKVLKAREQGTEEKQKDSPVTLLKRKVAELERALAETQAKLARKDDGSLFDLKADSVEDIAAAIAANLHEGKAAALAKALPEAIKGRKRQRQRPAG
jgi:glutathione S-transferase